MARRRARRTVRARRRAPARRRSTRTGMVRRTARRAYEPARRSYRRRSNPKGIMDTAGFRYATSAGLGAGAEVIINQTGFLSQTVPNRLVRAAIFAVLAGFMARQAKGRRKEQLAAAAVGIMFPPLLAQLGTFQLGSALTGQIFSGGNGNGNGNGNPGITSRGVTRLPSATSYARSHAVRAAGLSLI